MATINIPVTDLTDFFIYYLSASIKDLDPETKKEFEKLFRFGGMKKFNIVNKAKFLQRYKILLQSMNNRQATRIEIISGDRPGEKTPDKKRPTVTRKIVRLIKSVDSERDAGFNSVHVATRLMEWC